MYVFFPLYSPQLTPRLIGFSTGLRDTIINFTEMTENMLNQRDSVYTMRYDKYQVKMGYMLHECIKLWPASPIFSCMCELKKEENKSINESHTSKSRFLMISVQFLALLSAIIRRKKSIFFCKKKKKKNQNIPTSICTVATLNYMKWVYVAVQLYLVHIFYCCKSATSKKVHVMNTSENTVLV